MKKLALVAILLSTTTAHAYTLEERTFPATVVHVTDGDTIIVHVNGWPIVFDPMEVRLDGIDTPESRKQDAKCIKELKLGLIAKGWMKAKLPVGTKVNVIWTGEREKYGRLLGTVILGSEVINKSLVQKGYAMEYHGATKGNWCK